jgi:hypothetical protein
VNFGEKFFLYFILGAVAPILCLLIGWWSSIPFVSEPQIKWFALTGLVLGILLDLIFLPSWVKKVYQIPWFVALVIYLFYQVGMFGFFMGVPVFNLFLAFPAGFYVGKRIGKNFQAEFKISLFAATIMAVISSASAVFALTDKYTAAGLKAIFNLSFLPSEQQLWFLTLTGGVTLVILAYLLARAGFKTAIHWL